MKSPYYIPVYQASVIIRGRMYELAYDTPQYSPEADEGFKILSHACKHILEEFVNM